MGQQDIDKKAKQMAGITIVFITVFFILYVCYVAQTSRPYVDIRTLNGIPTVGEKCSIEISDDGQCIWETSYNDIHSLKKLYYNMYLVPYQGKEDTYI